MVRTVAGATQTMRTQVLCVCVGYTSPRGPYISRSKTLSSIRFHANRANIPALMCAKHQQFQSAQTCFSPWKRSLNMCISPPTCNPIVSLSSFACPVNNNVQHAGLRLSQKTCRVKGKKQHAITLLIPDDCSRELGINLVLLLWRWFRLVNQVHVSKGTSRMLVQKHVSECNYSS